MLAFQTSVSLSMRHILRERNCAPCASSLELAIDNADNKKHQNGNDRNRYNPICSHPTQFRISVTLHLQHQPQGKRSHLRAIPLNVLTLRSTYPSLCCRFRCVFSITFRCWCRSASVPAPMDSVSSAMRWLSRRRSELRPRRSVPERSCWRCSSWASWPLGGSSV
jgi:hypothetical protein